MLLAKGFSEENIKVLNDEDEGVDEPSGTNFKKALDWLCTGRSKDDIIFCHYSGHGTQIPSDGDDHEEDSKDEAIVLEGMFLVSDDDFKQFFSKLPEGCQATVITDCCHSGGMLE
jgi:Caspase domain